MSFIESDFIRRFNRFFRSMLIRHRNPLDSRLKRIVCHRSMLSELETLEYRICLSTSSLPVVGPIAVATPAETVQFGNDGSVYVRVGNPQDAGSFRGQGGVALIGGGTDYFPAFQWMMSRMGGKGDFLVLGASGSNDIIRGNSSVDYNQDLYALGGSNSVATLIIPDREAAFDPSVAQIISRADGIFIKGGSQNKYLDWWKGTPVSQAINNSIARGVPVGGTSAGTDVLSQFIYSSEYDSTRSTQAMADPFDPNLTLDQNFIAPNLYPFLNNTYVDTHFENRNRLGRMVTVLARIDANGWSRNRQPMGIGINQETALLIEPNGQARVVGNVDASGTPPAVDFVMTPGYPQVITPGQPLTYTNLQVEHLGVGGTFNLNNWKASFQGSGPLASIFTASVTTGNLDVSDGTTSSSSTVASTSIPANPPSVPRFVPSTVVRPAISFGSTAATSLTPTSFVDSYGSTPGQVVSLRDAVAAANASTATGTVTINLQSGEYLLSLPQIGNEDGTAGNLVVSNSRHTLLIKGKGTTGPNATIINARLLNDRILQMLPGSTVVLQDLILTGGLATDNGIAETGTAEGGAILDLGQSLTLNNVWVVANRAQGVAGSGADGGGIYSIGGTVALYRSMLAMNSAAGGSGAAGTNGAMGRGGGLYAAAGSVILGTASQPVKIESNFATGGAGGSSAVGGSGGSGLGGGIYLGGGQLALSLTSNRSVISYNAVSGGGGGSASSDAGGSGGSALGAGLFVAGGSVSVTIKSSDDVFHSNRASGGVGSTGGTGGAAQGAGLYLTGGSLSLLRDQFTNNVALGGNGAAGGEADGAGLFVAGGSTQVTSTLFSSNVALGGAATSRAESGGAARGGGIYASGGSLNLSSNVVSGNQAHGGSGGDISSEPAGGTGGQSGGGGLFAAGTSITMISASNLYTANVTIGGRGGFAANGGAGGEADGGGAFVEIGSFTSRNDRFSSNSAIGGIGGQAETGGQGGLAGSAQGGGLFVFRDTPRNLVVLSGDVITVNSVLGGTGGGVFSGGVGGAGGNGAGGGLFTVNFLPIVSTNLIIGNSAKAGVGGLALKNGKGGIAAGPNTNFAGVPVPLSPKS